MKFREQEYIYKRGSIENMVFHEYTELASTVINMRHLVLTLCVSGNSSPIG